MSQISGIYFGLSPPRRQTDMLSSMFSSMMGGGQSSSDEQSLSIKQLARPAVPESKKAAPAPASAPAANEADQLVDEEMD